MDKYIVKRSEIASMQGLSKTHFLNPNANRTNKSLGDLTGLTGFGFHIIEVPAGSETTEQHVHHHEDECVYVLEGQATAIIDDEEHAIEAGDFIGYRAGGKSHTIKNTSDTTFKAIVVGQRLAHDVADYTIQKKRIYRQDGLEWDLVDHENINHPKAGKK